VKDRRSKAQKGQIDEGCHGYHGKSFEGHQKDRSEGY